MKKEQSYTAVASDVKLAQNGDEKAMNRILEAVQDMVYYNCLRMLKNEAKAQDAAQDILITVYQKVKTLSDPQSYVGWVKRVTANHCKSLLCKVNREFLLSENEDGEDPFANFEDTDEQRIPDKALDNEETRRMINELVDRLPDEQRMCVMLYYYDEMKTREIADALNASEGTIKSRLNYARKSIKEGVKAFEKQGVKLYGASPIPFLTYFLAKSAAGVSAPIAAASITAAATATAATATAATAATTAASSGIAAFFASAAGKVAVAVAIAAAVGGVGTGVVLATQKSAEPAIVIEETAIPSIAYTPMPAPTATPVPTPELTPQPPPESTPEPETPEETLERLTELPEIEATFLMDSLYKILAGENDLGYVTDSSVVEIWEEHSLAAYRAFRQTKEWTLDVPESELPCYGARLENGVGLYMYLGDGLPDKDGRIEHEWVIYRVRFMDSDEYLTKLDYLEGPQWTEWSAEEPPEDALEIRTMEGSRGRWENDSWFSADRSTATTEAGWNADLEQYLAGLRMDGWTSIRVHKSVKESEDWVYQEDTANPERYFESNTYSNENHYKFEDNEGQEGICKVFWKGRCILVTMDCYSAWSRIFPESVDEINANWELRERYERETHTFIGFDEDRSHGFYTGDDMFVLQSVTLYSYRRR